VENFEMRWYTFVMYLLPALAVLIGILYRESFDLHYYSVPELPKPNIGHIILETRLKEVPLAIVFFEPYRQSDKRDALIKDLLEHNITIPIIVTPCDDYLEHEHGCYKCSGFIFVFKHGRRLDNYFTATPNYETKMNTAEQVLRYVDKITQNYDVFISREALEKQISKHKRFNLTTIVQFSRDCSKWTHGLFVKTIEREYSRDDTVRVALVRNESLIQEYTNNTKDSFMIASPYDDEPVFSSDYVNLKTLIDRYYPIFVQISKENKDASVAIVSINQEELEQISRIMIPIARHFRCRLSFAYNVTVTQKSLQIQMDRHRLHHIAYWYNGDLEKSSDIITWVDSVLNKTQVRSQLIPKNEKFVKVLVGDTVEEFIHQERDVVLLVKRYYWSQEDEDNFVPILNKLETIAKEKHLSIGIIDRFRNDIPSLNNIKSSRKLLTLYFPVGRKSDPIWIDESAIESEIMKTIYQYNIS
jgi:hypothetical protein